MALPKFTLPSGTCICRKPDCQIPYGQCHCGCGGLTQRADVSSTRMKIIAGQPRHYIFKHQPKKPRRVVTQPVDPTLAHIGLTKGQVAVVDVFLYEWLSGWLWYAYWNRSTKTYYAARSDYSTDRQRRVFMHRQILGLELDDPREGDHIAVKQTLLNTGKNLRIATHSQNMMNRLIQSNNTSGFKGVSPHPDGGYVAMIGRDGQQKYLGKRATAEEAAELYAAAAPREHQEFARLH